VAAVSKIWNGSSWINPFFLYPKVWNGTDWVYGLPKIWAIAQATDSKIVAVGVNYTFIQGGGGIPGPGGGVPPQTITTCGYLKDNYGNINSTASALYTGWEPLTIDQITYLERVNDNTGGIIIQTITLIINGAPNSGWTTMTINGTSYSRASAAYTTGGTWVWTPTSNPFGTTPGSQITVTWA